MDIYRVRSRIQRPSRGTFRTRRYGENDVVLSDVTEEQSELGLFEYIADFNHPGFAKRSEAGEVVMGPLSLSKGELTYTPGSLRTPRMSIEGDILSIFQGGVNPPDLPQRTSSIQSCKDRAAVSALKKLNLAEVDSGEILGTLAQTVDMFRRPFSNASKLLHKMERRRVRQLKKGRSSQYWAKVTSNTWLEYSFGWRPIFEDISKISSIFVDEVELVQTALRRARGKGEGVIQASSSGTHVYGGENPYSGTIAVTSHSIKTKIKCGAGIYYKLPLGTPAETLARGLGLGVNNLPISGWNLIPYSWVVDEIVNVGDWIQACLPDPSLVVVGKWMTTVEETQIDSSQELRLYATDHYGNSAWCTGTGGNRKQVSTTVTRVLDFSLPSTPLFNPRLGNLAIAFNNVAFGFLQLNRMLSRWAH